MTKKTKRAIVLIVALGSLATAGAAVAGGTDDDRGSDDAGERITDKAAADRASAAALREVGGGTVEGVENADDGEKGYEVEVRRADGSGAEVQVSPGFEVRAVENDD
jgi:uncharacterized membrane protein YkoI